MLPIPDFNSAMRAQFIDCCELHWALISPAIFGAMFQKIIELDAKDRRRQLGAHYTSETNILKLIGPLFLDELRAVLDARAAHPGDTLAGLYDPIAMPDDLRRVHKALDKAVDAAYAADGGKKSWVDDAERVGFLFQRYAALTGLLGGVSDAGALGV